jgi:hypothetical protein
MGSIGILWKLSQNTPAALPQPTPKQPAKPQRIEEIEGFKNLKDKIYENIN